MVWVRIWLKMPGNAIFATFLILAKNPELAFLGKMAFLDPSSAKLHFGEQYHKIKVAGNQNLHLKCKIWVYMKQVCVEQDEKMPCWEMWAVWAVLAR